MQPYNQVPECLIMSQVDLQVNLVSWSDDDFLELPVTPQHLLAGGQLLLGGLCGCGAVLLGCLHDFDIRCVRFLYGLELIKEAVPSAALLLRGGSLGS